MIFLAPSWLPFYMLLLSWVYVSPDSEVFLQIWCLINISLLQFVIMPMDNGRLTTADKKRPCILGLVVNNGYPQCGHVDGQNEQISHLKDTAGSQKIVMCQSLFDPSGFLRK